MKKFRTIDRNHEESVEQMYSDVFGPVDLFKGVSELAEDYERLTKKVGDMPLDPHRTVRGQTNFLRADRRPQLM